MRFTKVNVAALIQRLTDEGGLNAADIARIAGVGEIDILNWETGLGDEPDPESIISLMRLEALLPDLSPERTRVWLLQTVEPSGRPRYAVLLTESA